METTATRSLNSLTKDEINQALEMAKMDHYMDGKVILLTEDRYDQALDFAREYFLKDEPLYKALNVEWSQELAEARFLPAFKLNLSLILVNPENDDIIALRSTSISKRGTILDMDDFKDGGLREMVRSDKVINECAKFHENYGVDEAVQYLGLAVAKKYRGRGIATRLVRLHLDFLRNLGISPLHVKVEGTSNYSKRLFENLGFQTLFELQYDDYRVEGQRVLFNTGADKSVKAFGYKLC